MTGIVNSTGARSGIIGTTVGTPTGVPANVVAYRASGESTPTGFSEYTSVRGRMIVGLPSGGADAGTVGTALTDEQNKSTTHDHTGPSHRHNTDRIAAAGSGQLRINETLGNTGSNVAGDYVNLDASFTNTDYGYKYTSLESGTTGTGAVATSDILAYIQLMVIKKD